MKLGMDFPKEWRLHSEKTKIALSDIAYGYAIETLMLRLENTTFAKYLWLMNEDALGEEAYRSNTKERLTFYYSEASRRIISDKLCAGANLSKALVTLFARELLETEQDSIIWTYYIEEKDARYSINMEGHFMDMKVPVVLMIEKLPENALSPMSKERRALYVKEHVMHYLVYSKESELAECLFEIVRKLELVTDMEAYHTANEILKTHSINGRHMMEAFLVLGEKEPKVLSMKRLQQLEGYQGYAYMRKKWEQYEKRHSNKPEDWSQVLERIIAFLKPIWKALCEQEIFFDDWMPELGRFLS